jgi:hypothetical protein
MMKLKYRLGEVILLCTLFFISTKGFSQVQTPRTNVAIDAKCNGFYEYLPKGYSKGPLRYPLLVFVHGLGELGNGGTDLPKVLRNGPPKLISKGLFPASFTVSGQQFSFIVLSPQYKDWPVPKDIQDVIDYAVKHYRVDINRIYLTGLSMGGGAVWNYAGDNKIYANRLAAILPVCGASYPDPTGRCRIMAASNLPVWATHNLKDPTCPTWYTINYVNGINNAVPPPTPRARMTIFNAVGHDAWTKTYDPNWLTGGMNVYQWMLQYHRKVAVLPLRLSYLQAQPSGISNVTVNWSTGSGENTGYFIIERSRDGVSFTAMDSIPLSNQIDGGLYSYTDKFAFPGTNFYRLSHTNTEKIRSYFDVLTVVSGSTLFRISPNPANNMIQLELSDPEKGLIKVWVVDAQGRIPMLWSFQKQEIIWRQSIDISSLHPGIYTLQLRGTKIKEARGLIKQ